MAKATGSIVVNANPDANGKEIVIDDGQGGAFSSITFVTTQANSHPADQNHAPLMTRFTTSTSNTRPQLYARFGTSHTYNTFPDDWGLDGTRPAKMLISDTVGNTISITFSTSTSATSGTSIFDGSNTDARKVSTGVYEVKGNTPSNRMGFVMFGVFKCVQDAIDNDGFDVEVDILHGSNGSSGSSLSDGNINYYILYLRSPNGSDLGPEHSGISLGLERASGTWTASSGTDFLSVGFAYNNTSGLGTLDGPNEAVYAMRTGPQDSLSSAAQTATEFATSIRQRINAMPIGITAAGSGTTVSLTNDAHGTDGNVTITTNDSTNFTVSGMSGGSAEGGGEGGGGGGGGGGAEETNDMARTRIGSKLIAVGGVSVSNLATGAVTKNKISSGSVEIGHLNFGEASSAQKASGSLETADLLAVYDKSANTMKAVSLEHLEAFMSASNPTHFTASGDTLLGSEGSDSGSIAVYNEFVTSLIPKTHNLNSLGSTTKAWNVVYAQSGSISDNLGVGGTISGSAVQAHTITVDKIVGKDIDGTSGNFTGTVTVASTLTANGDVDLGDATSDTITATGRFDSDLVPSTHEARDLGSDALSWDTVFAKSGSFNSHIGTQGGVTAAGTISGSAGTFHTLTADHLDVQVINSTVRTNTTLEVADKLIVSALTASSADASGGGLKIGGSSSTFGLAEMLWDHANQSLDFNISGSTQVRLADGVLRPETNNDVDLGASGAQFKDLYLDGTAHVDQIVFTPSSGDTVTFDAAADGVLTVTTVDGAGTAADINLIADGQIEYRANDTAGHIFDINGTDQLAIKDGIVEPVTDNDIDLGSADNSFKNAHIQGTATVGTVTATNVDGILGANTPAAATVTSLVTQNGATVGGLLAADVLGVAGDALITGSLETGKGATIGGLLAADVLGVAGDALITGSLETGKGATIGGLLAADVLGVAGDALITGSLQVNGNVDLGDATSDTITATGRFDSDLVPSTDSARALGTSALQWSAIHVDAGHIDALHGTGIVTIDNLGTGSIDTPHVLDSAISTAKIAAEAVTKAKLNADIVRNDSDAHGGLIITSGRLSVGFRQRAFVRADGSNISGSVPTKGMYATDAMATPYTTASLDNECVSGSLMVYLNGVLLHSSHPGNIGPNEADYRLTTASNDYKILLNESLALDSDDILTVTFFSGSDGTPV